MAEKSQTKAAAAMADDKKRAIETAMQQIERTYGKVERGEIDLFEREK